MLLPPLMSISPEQALHTETSSPPTTISATLQQNQPPVIHYGFPSPVLRSKPSAPTDYLRTLIQPIKMDHWHDTMAFPAWRRKGSTLARPPPRPEPRIRNIEYYPSEASSMYSASMSMSDSTGRSMSYPVSYLSDSTYSSWGSFYCQGLDNSNANPAPKASNSRLQFCKVPVKTPKPTAAGLHELLTATTRPRASKSPPPDSNSLTSIGEKLVQQGLRPWDTPLRSAVSSPIKQGDAGKAPRGRAIQGIKRVRLPSVSTARAGKRACLTAWTPYPPRVATPVITAENASVRVSVVEEDAREAADEWYAELLDACMAEEVVVEPLRFIRYESSAQLVA